MLTQYTKCIVLWHAAVAVCHKYGGHTDMEMCNMTVEYL